MNLRNGQYLPGCMYFGASLLLLFILMPLSINADSWKWIAYGDTRNNPPRTQHKQIMQSMVVNTPDYVFIINVGDVVDHGDNRSEWEGFYQETKSVLGGFDQDFIPPQYMAAPGNHDNTETISGLTNWNLYLSGQVEQYGNEGKFFFFDYENARFVILDSDKSSKTGTQYTMLLDAIENNPKTWLFAFWHHPIFDFGEKSYQDDIHDTWGIPLYQNGCDIIFTGHAHYYVRSKKLQLNGEKNPPLDPENGTVQVVTGNGGAPIDIPEPNHDGNGYFVAAYGKNSNHYGYTELTVGADSLRLRHYLREGTVYDEEFYTPNRKTGSIIIGDVDGDESIDILDVLAIVNHILSIQVLDENALQRADCNGDEQIDMLDALGIVNVVLGIGGCTSETFRSESTSVEREGHESILDTQGE
ncbi:MAG: metallophosphoesterase [Gemmatimonadota bacterium]|nr:MAG: metallophosphoesterase [Gemmatimonadota bacterium]